ncbi:MAG: hypothetical protein ACREL7_16275 [Longimicrobiales bacterium]
MRIILQSFGRTAVTMTAAVVFPAVQVRVMVTSTTLLRVTLNVPVPTWPGRQRNSNQV